MIESQSATFPFLSLPRELRDIVYGYYHPFLSKRPIYLNVWYDTSPSSPSVMIDTLGIVPNRRNSLALLGVNKMIADETCFLLHEPTYTATITKLMLFERLHNFHIDFSQVLDLGERSTLRIELLSTSSVDFSDDKAKGKELVDGPMMQDALGSIIDCLRDAYSISQKFRGLTRIEIVVQGPLSDRLTKKTEIELEDQFFDCVLIVLEKMEDRLHEF